MLPRTLKEFLVYYWRFDPRRWMLFMAQDFVHYCRYPLAFMFVGKCIDSIAHASPADGIPARAWVMAACIPLVLTVGELSHFWTEYLGRQWKPKLRMHIRADFFNYLLGHSHSYFQNNFAGSLSRKVTEVAESSVRLHDHIRFSLFGPFMTMTISSIGLLAISPVYGVILFLFMLSIIGPVTFRLRRIGERARAFSEIRATVTGTIVDILSNISSTRNFARAAYEQDLHRLDSEAERDIDRRRMLTLIQISHYRRLCLVLLGSGMMFSLLLGWQAGNVTVGEIGAVMGLTFSLTAATWIIGFGIIMVADELGYIDDALRMITPPHDITDAPNAKTLVPSGGRITFENVDFHFGERPIFPGLKLEIKPGQRIGLLGPSGAGKSTLINLLLRLYELQGGRILIDGQDIAQVTQDSLRAAIALIPQDTALFHRSLADNIRYGALDADDAAIVTAARRAHAHEFVADMAEGYDTVVGERGIKLSGGQRQRIAIARAMLKNAPILILDEATSALDSESEKVIQESLFDLMEGKTVIAIAHRLSTIAHMDRLIVMEKGVIVEDGTHAELLAANGLYAKLWTMQSGGFLGE